MKPTGTRPARDPEATGPRDWTEYAAARAARALADPRPTTWGEIVAAGPRDPAEPKPAP
jgi:hypothetical protein